MDAPQVKLARLERRIATRNAKADLAICDAATPGPWYTFIADDADCSNVVGVATVRDLCLDDVGAAEKLIAVTLMHGAAKVRATIGDDREEENAAFCAMAREALPYWIRLALVREAALYQLRSGRSR